jgi:hypothetical protein
MVGMARPRFVERQHAGTTGVGEGVGTGVTEWAKLGGNNAGKRRALARANEAAQSQETEGTRHIRAKRNDGRAAISTRFFYGHRA